jgi:acetyl esterase/lipase
MPVARLGAFREDVRQFLEKDAKIQAKISMEYISKSAPEILKIWPKVVENNEKLFKGEVSIRDLWKVITEEERVMLASMLRHSTKQKAAMKMEQVPLPPDVKIESVECDGVEAEWQIVPGAAEEKVLLYFHGGGWILGSPYVFRPLSVALGEATGMRVLSVNYRLAPENPFPAALDDCTKAYRWLLGQGFKPQNIVIAGDSAGGNLTLATILNLRENETALPKGVVCFSPSVDLQFDSIFSSHGETDPILADVGFFWWVSAYVGINNSEKLTNPMVSPIFGDLGGFPPLLVQATPSEILYQDARQLVSKVIAQGGDATLQTWDGMVHVWQFFFIDEFPESRDAINKAGEWVRELFMR